MNLTIEALAARSGVTVRNIRAYQTKGLLPPPALKGRTGYYGDEHVARLRLIKEMQSSGFGLKAIKRLLESAPRGLEDEVLRFEQTLLAPWSSEGPEVVEAAALAERFGSPDPALVERAQVLGLLEPLPAGRVKVNAPSLLAVADELQDMGISLEDLVTVVEKVDRNADRITKTFVDLFIRQVWRPFDRAGRPAERWPEIRASLEKLRTIASRVVLSVFALSMTKAVEEAFAEELERASATKASA